jgi:RimJ/RimL family protein N-acetyltransferase
LSTLPVIESERLVIRPLDAGDLMACQAMDPGVDPVACERWLRWQVASYPELEALRQPPYGERGIELAASGELVGLVGLVPSLGPFASLESWPRERDPALAARWIPAVGLYWLLHPDHRGSGYATEAARALAECSFDQLDLARLVATTEHDNLASQAVMRRLGMRIERNPSPEPPWFQTIGILDHW